MLNANGPGFAGLYAGDVVQFRHPASKEAGRKLTCAQCLACAGTDGRRGASFERI